MDELTDEALMLRVARGNLELLGALFDRFSGPVHDLCLRWTRSPELAEDLLQEVFLRALRYRRSFRGAGSFRAWLFQLARNTCRDELARQGRGMQEIPDPAGLEEPRRADPREDVQRVRAALERLPFDQRQILELKWFQGLAAPEIARHVGCEPGAARVRLYRAHRRLCTLLTELPEDVS